MLFTVFPCFLFCELSKPQIPKLRIMRAACTWLDHSFSFLVILLSNVIGNILQRIRDKRKLELLISPVIDLFQHSFTQGNVPKSLTILNMRQIFLLHKNGLTWRNISLSMVNFVPEFWSKRRADRSRWFCTWFLLI